MIVDASSTWGLVVAIDRYDDPAIPALDSPVTSAAKAVSWLKKLGVSPEKILVHAPESSDHLSELTDIGVDPKPATKRAIDVSVSGLISDESWAPQRLYVFLMGHGYWLDKAPGRILLTQEARAGIGPWSNLGVDDYIRAFRSCRSLKEVFLFFDACSNAPFSEQQRENIAPSGLEAFAPSRPTRGQTITACYAASQEEYAEEQGDIGARQSVFMQRLLELIDPDQASRERYRYDDQNRPYLDFADLFHRHLERAVRLETEDRQSPALDLIPKHRSVVPLFTLMERVADVSQARYRQAVEKFNRRVIGEDDPLADLRLALQHRVDLLRVRQLHHSCLVFRDIALALRHRPARTESMRIAQFDAAWAIFLDIEAEIDWVFRNYPAWRLPDDVLKGGSDGIKKAVRAVAIGQGAEPGKPWTAPNVDRLVRGSLELRCAIEAGFAQAVMVAVDVSMTSEKARSAMRQRVSAWIAASDGGILLSKLAAVHDRGVAIAGGPLPVRLLRDHAELENVRWQFSARLDQVLAEPMATDYLDRLQLAHDHLRTGPGERPEVDLAEVIGELDAVYTELDRAIGQLIEDALRAAAGTGRMAS